MTPPSTREADSVPRGASTRGHDEGAPLRRLGRDCGYAGREELGMARLRIGAALTALARDKDPQARRIGAELAREATRALDAISVRAEASTSTARRIAASVERRLPRLEAQLAEARSRVGRGPSEGTT